MHAIFYDLETSDSEPIGQILNYSFIAVDKSFQILSEQTGDIRISRLQLPRAGAILANRVNVLEHQKQARDSEQVAMKKIWDYLMEANQAARGPVALIGFNSSRFDLGYLRTAMIRNGLNPYTWKERLIDRDLLLAARKLAVSRADFPRPRANPEPKDGPKLSLRLESLCQHFGLLKGKQTHNSRDDVLLTIALAELLRSKFGLDACTYDAYEARSLDRQMRKPLVTWALDPNYDLSKPELSVPVPYTLLDASPSYGLWVNLEAFKKDSSKRSAYAIKKVGGSFFLNPEQPADPALNELATKAQESFKALSLGNYFEERECDIEQFIYRLDFDARDRLSEAIWEGNTKGLAQTKSVDGKTLYLRFLLANYEWGGSKDGEMEENLRQYASRRYGGKVILSKNTYGEGETRLHPTFEQLKAELNEALDRAAPDDAKLLQALKEYYQNSDLFRVSGQSFEN